MHCSTDTCDRSWQSPSLSRTRMSSFLGVGVISILVVVVISSDVLAEDTAGIKSRTGRRPVELRPIPEDRKGEAQKPELILGDWLYRVTKAPSPKNGVPWQLIVTPTGEDAVSWKKEPLPRISPLAHEAVSRVRVASSYQQNRIPVVEMPEKLWRLRMDADLQNVVGIHFHEYVSDDVARVLFTLHKVPPDNPDGTPPAPGSYQGLSGTRLEATLLAPVVWSLDQSIVVRVDDITVPEAHKRKQLVNHRTQHEFGHAEVSQQVLLDVLRGPQTWNQEYCTGRRSHLAYYWRRQQIGRSWNGYQRDGKLLTLRTTIALVPPTRWSKLLPIPPERVTQKHIQQFNDEIILLDSSFTKADKLAQRNFHAHHGEYERPGTP